MEEKTATYVTFTPLEEEIAELVAWGASKKEIANKLFISERTVENTVRSIYKKVGVSKSNEFAAWWFCDHFDIPKHLSPLTGIRNEENDETETKE